MKNLTSKAIFRKSVLKLIKECLQLYRRKQYLKTVVQADKILQMCPLNVPVLIVKARAIQLLTEKAMIKRYTLQAAKDTLLLAREADPHSAEALNELAFYLYAVEDNSGKAHDVFEDSITIGLVNLTEAIAGQLKCLIDSNRMTEKEAGRAVRKSKVLLSQLARLRKPTRRESSTPGATH